MLNKENIICISSIDWDFNWQGHQEIMSTFAKNNNRVLFIENTGIRMPHWKDIPRLKSRIANWFKSVRGFRKMAENLYIYSPLILPFPYSRLARYINRWLFIGPLKKWLKAADFGDPIIWSFLPTLTAMDMIEHIDNKLVIYYCIADFSKVADHKKVQRVESELIKKSDVVFVQGEALKKKCDGLNDNVYVFPFGVNINNFVDFQPKPAPPGDIVNLKKPIIGYIGGIHQHVDLDLLRFLAEKHRSWSFVMVGPVVTDISVLDGLKNIYFPGKKDFSDLPAYISQFDACIIPYLHNSYTETVFPTKLNEYLAMGKPVISTALPEVLKFNKENNNVVMIADNHNDFSRYIEAAVMDKDNKSSRIRVASARKHSWGVRIEEMSRALERALQDRFNSQSDWQKKFLSFYRTARNKTFSLGIKALFLYLLVFYTPFIWIIAKPLKIDQRPQKADAIVVFAGGVGESGKPQQGYEERVQYAVELYNQKYAGNIIFSSGYMHVYKEPLIMKALAVSLGVPEGAIILEDQAKNTYENVLFSTNILLKNRWHKILLVSSPYHMRRASLVFTKNARGIDVYYTSLPESLFYSQDKSKGIINQKINIGQIRAIFHEYLGILYYWYKGWI